jgi:hypothetical protein
VLDGMSLAYYRPDKVWLHRGLSPPLSLFGILQRRSAYLGRIDLSTVSELVTLESDKATKLFGLQYVAAVSSRLSCNSATFDC